MEAHQLSDGTGVRIRPIAPGDKERLTAALGRLSEETIHKRFLAAKRHFSAAELRYLTEVDGVNHIALVAVLESDPDAIVAVARCVRFRERPDTAEMSIVVGDSFQKRGLGRHLALRLADAAKAVGIRRFAATMLAENQAAIRLMHAIARRMEDDHRDGPLREIVLDLAVQGPVTRRAA